MHRRKFKGIPGMQWFTACISITMVLIMTGMIALLSIAGWKLSESIKENIQVSAVINHDASFSEIKKLRNEIKNNPYVNKIRYISAEEALKEQVTAMGSDPSDFIGFNPFQPSIEIYLKADYANTESLSAISSDIKKYDIVEEVIYQKELIDGVNRNIQKIGLAFLVIAALLTFISVSLINNTVRLSIYSGRFLIRTMQLVGATNGFIRKPFLIKGFILALISSLLANGFIAACLHFATQYDKSVLDFVNINNVAICMGGVFIFGFILTEWCTAACVNRYIKSKTEQLY